jgi:hypothetical protein
MGDLDVRVQALVLCEQFLVAELGERADGELHLAPVATGATAGSLVATGRQAGHRDKGERAG